MSGNETTGTKPAASSASKASAVRVSRLGVQFCANKRFIESIRGSVRVLAERVGS